MIGFLRLIAVVLVMGTTGGLILSWMRPSPTEATIFFYVWCAVFVWAVTHFCVGAKEARFMVFYMLGLAGFCLAVFVLSFLFIPL